MNLDPDFEDAILSLLAESTTFSLATTEADGSPRATPLFFAVGRNLELLFLSDPETPHIRNVLRSPAAAAAAYPEVSDWRQIRGVQFKGTVERVPQNEIENAFELYRARFPYVEEVGSALENSELYAFRPRWIRLIDNRQGFGHKREVSL